jgi:capsular exopolysaccharide synthesis family protein
MISLYALPDNARMMEVPYTKVTPIKPNKRNICLMGLLLGIMIPPGIFFIKESLRRKVYGKQDVEKRTKLPVFAIIPKAKDDIILVDFKNKDKITEAFRMLRANMQFLEGKVIQVTSSIAGEGKSTISTNLAIALASIGKKVILVGMDLRKPKIHKIFDISNNAGVTSFLIGKETDVSNLITPSKVHENLHVMTAGPIPPNPSELLSTSKVSELLKPLTNNYDFIIMDTSPCFLAADTFNIARYSDITLYVIRSKMADLRMIPQIQEFHDTGKLPKVSLVINAVNFSKNAYGHGYRYGYGYGYGYGVEENEKRKKRLN